MRFLGCGLLGFSLVACSSIAEPTCPWCEPPSEELVSIQDTSWLVSSVALPRASMRDLNGFTHAPGFDLDRFDSGTGDERDLGCDRAYPDHHSTLDPDLAGVDNATQELASAADQLHDGTVESDLALAVSEGRIRWAIRVGSLSEEDEEGDVSLPIDLVAIDEAQSIMVDALGVPLADQELRGTVIASASAVVRRSDAWGRGLVQGLPVQDPEVPFLPFDAFWLAAFGIDARLAPSGTLVGNLGGSFDVDDLVDATVRYLSDYENVAEYARSIIQPVADLDPSAEDPAVCARVSAGFAFEAVPMVLHVE